MDSNTLEEDKDLAFVSSFSDAIKEIDLASKKDFLNKLWNTIISLLKKYPKNVTVLETVCSTFTTSTVHAAIPTPYENFESLVSQFLTTLTNFDWTNSSINLVKLAVEVTGSLADLFELEMSSDHISSLSSLLSTLLDPDTYNENKIMFVLTAGKAFPHSFSDRVLYKLLQDKVYIKICQLLSYYSEMSEDQLKSIIETVIAFVDYKNNIVNDIAQETVHVMLLFAAQQYTSSESVQALIWTLMSILVENCPDIIPDMDPSTIVPLLEKVTNIATVHPICIFIVSYLKCAGPGLIEFCFKESQELIRIFIKILEDLPSDITIAQGKKITVVCKLLGIFSSVRSELKEIISLKIIPALSNAAIKWPTFCFSMYCLALVDVLPVVAAYEHLFKRKNSEIKENISEKFYTENYILPFQTFLKTSSLLPDAKTLIYSSLKSLLRHAPEESIDLWINKEFLEIFIPAFATDVTQCNITELHNYVFTAHILTYFLKSKELVQLIYDLKLHETAIDVCLMRANYREGRMNTLNFINCLLRTYNEFIKDETIVFAKSELPNIIIQLAIQYGEGNKSEIGDQFSSLALGLTADKNASNVFYDRGIHKKFYSLINTKYDPVIIRNAIHAVGNIALAGHNVKQDILSDKFQDFLINLIDKVMETIDSSVLTASCRVLHILCSGDMAKREFAEKGLVNILIRLLQTRGVSESSTPEMSWRPLGLLSSISFMSLCNRQYLITDKILTSVMDLMKTAKDTKVISYYALVFLACTDIDRHSALIRQSGVVEKFQEFLSDDSLSSNNDLKRWGTSLLEKCHLFTLKETINDTTDNLLFDSFMWPPSFSLFTEINEVKLISEQESQLVAKFPEGSTLNEDQIKGLGLTLDHTLFRISRVYGSTHGLCSNCEKEGSSEELVFRPHNLTPNQYQALITRGWYRRGGVKFFRYRYNHSLDCSDWETRVILSQFDSKKRKSYRKVLRKMPEENLTIETIPTQFVQEAYDLYNTYHSLKHDKPSKSRYSYCEHVVNSPMRNQTIDGMDYGTFHQLYRLNGKLIAVGVIDVVPNGVVSIYMWYDMSKEVTKLSPGVYSALKEIEYAQGLSKRDSNIQYYYLQGWNGNNHKLSYKGNYEPEDFYSPCTVVDWVRGLDGVTQARKEYISANSKDETDSAIVSESSSSKESQEANGKETVSGIALPLDRKWYKNVTGHDTVDTSKLVVCLNDKTCIYLSDVISKYGLTDEQCSMMKERFEELVLAVGPELASNMIIDLKLC